MIIGLSKMETKEIERRANEISSIARRYNLIQNKRIDITRLARLFGFEVCETDRLSAFEDGCMTISSDSRTKQILLNQLRSIEFKRFIIAHELAHYFLHYTPNTEVFMRRDHIKGKDDEEQDADYFAACILMPKEDFKKEYDLLKKHQTHRGTVLALQNIFATPTESIERRINEVC